MKRPVSWHEECLINAKQSLAREKLALGEQRLRVGRLSDGIVFAERQISEAKRRGMTEFDGDMFLVKYRRTGSPK